MGLSQIRRALGGLIAVVFVAGCTAALPTGTPGATSSRTATVGPATTPCPTQQAIPSESPPAAGACAVLPGGTFGPLTFDDEFNGAELDTSRWHVDAAQDMGPDQPWRRNYKNENVYLKDGALVIRAAKENPGYSTAAIVTGKKGQPNPFEQAFGRYETRMRLPTQPGHGGAFWLWNESETNVDGSGRDGTEIDIFERIWLDDTADHALHWDGYDADQQSAVQMVKGMGLTDGGWHTIRLDWYPDRYVFFIDGKETWHTSAGGVDQTPNFVILSDEICNWGTAPIDQATLPDYTYYDYVRVWAYVPPQQ
jgi:beta-glucanase (GH16 family)